MEPVTPVALLAGLSTDPAGGLLAPCDRTRRDTVIGAMVLEAPVAAIVTVAELFAEGTAAGTSDTVSAPDPLPDPGDTDSQAADEDAVHEIAPAPDCVSRTDCAAVRVCGAPLMMPKASDDRSAPS